MPPRSKRRKNDNENGSYVYQAAIVIKNNNPRTPGSYILISRKTGFMDVWIGDHHYYRNDFAQTNPYPTIQGNTYEAHYNMSSSEAQNINIDNIVQAIEDQKPKQTIVIRRRKRG